MVLAPARLHTHLENFDMRIFAYRSDAVPQRYIITCVHRNCVPVQILGVSSEWLSGTERHICRIACAVLNTLLRWIFFVLVMAIGLSRIVVLVIFL